MIRIYSVCHTPFPNIIPIPSRCLIDCSTFYSLTCFSSPICCFAFCCLLFATVLPLPSVVCPCGICATGWPLQLTESSKTLEEQLQLWELLLQRFRIDNTIYYKFSHLSSRSCSDFSLQCTVGFCPGVCRRCQHAMHKETLKETLIFRCLHASMKVQEFYTTDIPETA